MMPNPASSYQNIVGVQPTPNLALTGNQQSNMGNQMQGMMVQYPPVQPYQVRWPCINVTAIDIRSMKMKESASSVWNVPLLLLFNITVTPREANEAFKSVHFMKNARVRM